MGVRQESCLELLLFLIRVHDSLLKPSALRNDVYADGASILTAYHEQRYRTERWLRNVS